jgi:DNA-binding transcriptional regulator YhcF (GntR family)
MATLQLLTASEQVAQHLRNEISKGRWARVMPGCNHLLKELGVGRNTIDAALLMLEEEGLLAPQGGGRRRLITRPRSQSLKALTIQVLVYDESQRKQSYLLDLIHGLRELGITTVLADKTLSDLKMPVVSHLHWDSRLLTRHVLRWVRQVARGKASRRQTLIKTDFVEGETIGPAPKLRASKR